MTTALDVAAYIRNTLNRGYRMDDFKLQKLVYFTQAWHLAWTARPLFDESFEAWPNGPVVRSVYRSNKYLELPQEPVLNDDERAVIDAVLEHYGRMDRDTLIALTHADAPWIEARKGLGPDAASRRCLDGKTMLDFYTAQALAGRDVPQRRAIATEADTTETAHQARLLIERWREGLDLLAHK